MKNDLIYWPTFLFGLASLLLGAVQLITGNAFSVFGPYCKDSFPAIAYLHLAIGVGLVIITSWKYQEWKHDNESGNINALAAIVIGSAFVVVSILLFILTGNRFYC